MISTKRLKAFLKLGSDFRSCPIVDDEFPALKNKFDRELNQLTCDLDLNENRNLSFDELRSANRQRLPLFKDAQGRPCHEGDTGDGETWSRQEWLEAVVGEVGEYANFSKKHNRGDLTYGQFIEHARKELADVQIYLDLLANRLNINLGEAVRDKFNEVSDRVGIDIKL